MATSPIESSVSTWASNCPLRSGGAACTESRRLVPVPVGVRDGLLDASLHEARQLVLADRVTVLARLVGLERELLAREQGQHAALPAHAARADHRDLQRILARERRS